MDNKNMEKKTNTRRNTWKDPMTEGEKETMKNFILWLYEGYLQFGADKYAGHILSIAVRDATRIIGVRRNTKISKKARKLLGLSAGCPNYKTLEKAQKVRPGETVEEHVKPVKQFYKQFKSKNFTVKDAERWFDEAVIAVITAAEDKKLTALGYREDRPPTAYKEAGIVLEDLLCDP